MPGRKSPIRKPEVLRRQGTLPPRPEQVVDPVFHSNDFFDPEDAVQVKYEMLRRVEVEGASVSQAASAFGFSRPSFYQAQASFQGSGLAGLIPQKKGPRRAHKLSTAVLDFVARLRTEERPLGWAELARKIREEFGINVHPRSVERALARHPQKRLGTEPR